jgi:hypothetical protein
MSHLRSEDSLGFVDSGIANHKLIASPVNSQEEARIGGVRLKSLPKTENVVVDGASGGIVLVSPDLIEKFFARKNSPGRRGEELQEFEFLGRQ